MSEESFSTFRVRLGLAKSTNVEYIFRSPPPQVRPDVLDSKTGYDMLNSINNGEDKRLAIDSRPQRSAV